MGKNVELKCFVPEKVDWFISLTKSLNTTAHDVYIWLYNVEDKYRGTQTSIKNSWDSWWGQFLGISLCIKKSFQYTHVINRQVH